jgi:uncharacterized protein
MAPTARIGRCPRCGKSVPLTADNPWRPFCSERCKTVDMGDWLSERHRIAGEAEPDKNQKPDPDP